MKNLLALLALPVLATLHTVLSGPVATSAVSYEGSQVHRFHIDSPQEAQSVAEFIEKYRLSSWAETAKFIDILIPKDSRALKEDLVDHFDHEQLIENVQSLIHQEAIYSKIKKAARIYTDTQNQVPSENDMLTDYHDYETILKFMGALPHVQQVNIGQTFEGRDMIGFKFGSGAKNIVFNGGIHAREWISPAVVIYMANYLTSNNATAIDLRNKFTFTVFPVLNPDGYAYTRSRDRFWRKNRQQLQGTSCVGIDPNRNFGFQWDADGSSHSPCQEDYRGPAPFVAAESKAITDYIKNLGDVISYIDFHSYSELWMFPYGYKCHSRIPEYNEVGQAARMAADAIRKSHGQSFTVGRKIYR